MPTEIIEGAKHAFGKLFIPLAEPSEPQTGGYFKAYGKDLFLYTPTGIISLMWTPDGSHEWQYGDDTKFREIGSLHGSIIVVEA